jgi:hypothetical protein
MHTTVVCYKTHPEHADQNAAFIKSVFDGLRRAKPTGLRYQAVRGRDGVTFTHVATVEDSEAASPLTTLPEFKAFVAELRQRCAEPPAFVEGDTLGRYEG